MSGFKKPPFVKLFDFKLYNIEDFVFNGFDEINPIIEEKRYRNYWEGHLEKLINGLWGYDYDKKRNKGGYRFMGPNLYHFVRFFRMRMEELGKSSSGLSNPVLRDLDWWVDYNMMASLDGFSGFKDDKKKTSNILVGKLKNNIELKEYEKIILEMYADDVRDKYGRFKEYVDPIEYLQSTHKEPLGVPLFQNEKENLIWFASRRVGKSYTGINRMQRGMVVNNASSIEEYYRKNTKFVGLFGSYGDTFTKEHLTKFFDSYNELAKFGAYKKDGLDFNGALWAPLTGTKTLGGFITNLNKDAGGKTDVLWGSQVHRFSFEKSESSGVGVASDYFMGDEIGLWDNLEGVNAEITPTQKRETKFGGSLYMGTGGQVTKALKTKKCYMNPSIIGARGFKDYCNLKNPIPMGMFTPVQYTRNVYRDENGNIDLEKSYRDEIRDREEKFKKGMPAYLKHIFSYCMTYNDIFMQSSTSILPVDRASENLEKTISVPVRQRNTTYSIGRLKYDEKEDVYFVEDNFVEPITNYDSLEKAEENQKNGVILIYEPPDKTGESFYLTTYDSVKDPTGTSSCVAAVWKIYGPTGTRTNVVAESIYRFVKPKDNDDVAIKLARYYSNNKKVCMLAPETNVPHIIIYSQEIGFYSQLADTPKLAISQLLKQSEKYEKGVYRSPGMNEDTPTVCAELLMTAVETIDQEDGTKKEVWMVDEIPSEFLLNDIIYWSLEGNFDYMINLFIFALYMKEWKLRKYFDKPIEGNDLYSEVKKALRQTDTISRDTDDVYFY